MEGATFSENGQEVAIEHLRQAIATGENWFVALLEAMALWTAPEEMVNGRHCQYLVGGEAFDWLLLAQRLAEEVQDHIPQAELEALLFRGKPPFPITSKELKEKLGLAKYRAYLNYFYGVEVEEALILAVEAEICKEWHCLGYAEPLVAGQAFEHLYAASQEELWEKFCQEKKYRRQRQVSLHQLKGFTYWLFRRRLGLWDKARVASDTRKGLEHWRQQRRLIDCRHDSAANLKSKDEKEVAWQR